MSAVLRTRGRLASVLAVLVAGLAAVPAAHADSTATSPYVLPPKAFYLALGDSLAYGYQQAKFNAEVAAGNVDPATFDTGYADDFFAAMSKLANGQQVLINDGCPGETSDSLINGGPVPGTCATGNGFPDALLHHPYLNGGSQLADALAFLQANGKKVNPITIDIGANDLLHAQTPCAVQGGGVGTPGDIACLQAVIGHVAQNLGSILGQIRAIVPNNEIIVMGLYNPQLNLLPLSDQLVEGGFNPTMAQVAAAYHAGFADPWPTINDNLATFGTEFNSVCSQIAICTALQDIHPFDNGYQAIANVIWQASGYSALK
jgi:lysophospholipase L1-like esterase